MSHKYEVVLEPAANRTVLGLQDPERKELAEALRTELLDGPNAAKEVGFDGDMRRIHSDKGVVYTGTPLSFHAYLAIHRPMTADELRRLRRQEGRRVAERGCFVVDILHPATAFTRAGYV
jgi:hypothetical protein